MKIIISLGKGFIIIYILLTIFTAILTFETLPIWEDNQRSISLPKDLNESEILDYAINNKSNYKIYLANRDDNYFFYLEDNKRFKYINNSKKDLKYFNSPLMEFNNELYFCSNLKHIIKINTSDELDEIENPKCLEQYTNDNYELKCFYHQEQNIVVATFLNTTCVSSYDLKKSEWIGKDIYIEKNIIDANAINVDNYDSYFGIGFLFKTTNLILWFFNYDKDLNLSGQHYLEIIQSKLYSKTLFTFGHKEIALKGFVFTYEPKKTNEYNFFYLNIEGKNCLTTEGKYYLTIFREAEIYDAFFVENTPILIYVIRKQEKDSNFNFYLGAVDIETLIILYNIKIDNYKKFFYDYGFAYSKDKKGFLRFFENGYQFEICPFIYNFEKNTCQLFPDESNFYFFDYSSGKNINSMIDTCSNNRISTNHYCIEECPQGLGLFNGKCIFCFSEYKIYLFAENECVTNYENSQYIKIDNLYYNCNDKNLKYFDYNCYESCSEIYGITKEDNINECETCGSKGKIFSNDICIDKCEEEGYGVINMTINNITYSFCQKCKITGQYYYNHHCYDKCPNKQQYDSEHICLHCENNTIFQNGTCVSKCGKGYQNLTNDVGEAECILCKNINKFYTHKNICEEKCENLSLYDSDNICYYCKEIDQFYYNNSCYEECPGKLGWYSDDRICDNCSNYDLVLKGHKCESTCGTYIKNKEGICEPCPENNNLFFEYECFDKCPENTVLIQEENYCQICNGKIQNKECVNECSYGYVINKTNIEGKKIIVEKCVTCEELNPLYHFNGKECVEDCPITKYAEGNYCRLCFCGFSLYNCNRSYDQCICNNSFIDGYIYGDNCEFYSKIKDEEKNVSIINLGSIISSKKSFFTFKLVINYL